MAAAESIITKFREFGLDEDEAKILTILYVMGPSKASTIAQAAGMTRIRAYRVLSRLQDKSIIETNLGRPVIFSVIPPDKAIDSFITETSNRVKIMQSTKEQILAELSKFKAHEPLAEAKHRIIEGRSQIYSTVSKMIRSAKSEILLFMDKEDLMRMYYAGIPEELSVAFSKGIKTMILADIDYSIEGNIQEYAKYATIRHNKIPGMNILLVIDDSELLLSSATKRAEGFSGESIVALWMNAKNFVMGMKGLLEDTWSNAIDVETRIKVLKEGGSAFQDILIVKGPKNIEEFCINMIETAKDEVCCIGVPFDGKLFSTSLEGPLRGLKQRRVKMKILTSIQNEILESIKSLTDFAEIKHTDAGFGMNVLLVDNSRILIIPSINLKAFVANAVWSSISDFVQHYRGIFSNLWQNATDASIKISQIEESIYLSKLSGELAQSFSDHGYKIEKSMKGISGSSHEFALIAKRRGKQSSASSRQAQQYETLVVDISASQDLESAKNALLGFVVKCIDIEADSKIFVSRFHIKDIKDLASSFDAGIEVAAAEDISRLLESMAGAKQKVAEK